MKFKVFVYSFNQEIGQKLEIMAAEFAPKYHSKVEFLLGEEFSEEDLKFLDEYLNSEGKGDGLFENRQLILKVGE